jgi:hypothetical protein
MGMRSGRVALSVTQQALGLRRRFPEGQVRIRPGELTWTGTIQPTPLSREYRVEVKYRIGRLPEVSVLDSLEGRPGEGLPHVYAGGTLCLHLPYEWLPDKFLADTTVAWAAEWLFYYEIWAATGEWHGGGKWPPERLVAP